MIQDLQGILPPEQIMEGQPYFFLKDLKDVGSYDIIKKDERGTEFTVGSKDVNNYLNLRNSLKSTTYTLWGTIEDLITQCQASSNPASHIELQYLYIEADSTIKQDVVPSGIRLADGTLTFEEWGANTENFTPTIAESLDGTKVVYAIHLVGGKDSVINMDEIKSWIEFASVSDKNVKLMTHFEYQNLTQSTAYNNE